MRVRRPFRRHPPTMRDHVSVSEIKAWLSCRRKHDIGYNLRISAIGRAYALRFGTALHKGIESWNLWRPTSELSRVDTALEGVRASAVDNKLDAFDVVKLEELMYGYDARYCDAGLENIGAEVPFLIPILDADGTDSGIDLKGSIDALVRAENGDVYIMEYKSASDASTGNYWTRLRVDLQIGAYLKAARVLGYEPKAVLYDVVEKPRIKPEKATPIEKRRYTKATGKLYSGQRAEDESPQEYRVRLVDYLTEKGDDVYKRVEIVRLAADEEQTTQDLFHIATDIVAKRGSYAPRNADACFAYGRECEFFGVCTGAADLSDPEMFERRLNSEERALKDAEGKQGKEEEVWEINL